MAKARKAHSKQARDQRLYANARVWMWESETATNGSEFVLHTKHKALAFGWLDLRDPQVVDNLLGRARNWLVCGRALVQSDDGAMWMEQADIALPSRKLLTVSGAYDTLREQVLSANQTRHVFDCGWIARTWLGPDPTDTDPSWVYHDAPPGICQDPKLAGLGFTEERRQVWQHKNANRSI